MILYRRISATPMSMCYRYFLYRCPKCNHKVRGTSDITIIFIWECFRSCCTNISNEVLQCCQCGESYDFVYWVKMIDKIDFLSLRLPYDSVHRL